MPAAHNTPGFASFSDYLNANQSSLEQEGQQALSGAQGAFGAAQSDLAGLEKGATDAGYAAGAAVPNTGGTWDVTADPNKQHRTETQLSYTPGEAPAYTPGAPDAAGTTAFQGDLSKAQDQLSALKAGGVPGRSAWEAGLIGGTAGFQQGVAGLDKQFGSSFSNYLDQIGAAGQKGYQAGLGSRAAPTYAPPPPTAPGTQEGPVMKPNRDLQSVWDPTLNGGKGGVRRMELP